ncbi:MAG TPA: hypothetical protein DIT99_12515 [Candidatus Latescibacteria bacterium]|nr:hypothetical protein [Candidatus Latescibacterota bacterium]
MEFDFLGIYITRNSIILCFSTLYDRKPLVFVLNLKSSRVKKDIKAVVIMKAIKMNSLRNYQAL